MSGLTGRSILVTGAASGIGLAVVRACAALGASVAGVDRDSAALRTAATRIAPGGFHAATADVSDERSVQTAVSVLGEQLGGFHGLVNCAGVGGYSGDVTQTAPEVWRNVLGVNLTGVYLVSRTVLPFMKKQAGASVVHVASQYGLVGGAGFPAYCAAKAGVIGLTRAMAVDHAPDGIRVNCVCPGPVDTPMLRRSAGTPDTAHREDERVRLRSLLPSPAAPSAVADVIAFLLGPGAGHITGAVLPVDGGWTAG